MLNIIMQISDKEFDRIISEALEELPKQYIEGLNNVAITYEDEPSAEQRTKLKLRCDQTLLGLFEGVANTGRPAINSIFSGQSTYLPDKITLFKKPLLGVSKNMAEFKKQVKHTLWHEIAHYYGLDHDRIHQIERGEL